MIIRYGNTADAAPLAEFGAKAFYDTFAPHNTEENIRLYLERTYSPELQRNELLDPNVIFLISEIEEQFAGYVKLTLDSRTEAVSAARTIELERIYAAAEHIGRGIGKALMEASIREAQQRDRNSIWLGVWERNPRAIAFYKKWGFREVGEQTFMLGDEPQRDLIMELILAPASMDSGGY